MNWLAKGVSDYGDSVYNTKNVSTPHQIVAAQKHPRGGGISSIEGPQKEIDHDIRFFSNFLFLNLDSLLLR